SSAFMLSLSGAKVKLITRSQEEASSCVAGGKLAPFSESLEGELFEFSYRSLKAYPEFVKLVKEVSNKRVDLWEGGIYRLVLKGEEELLKRVEDYKSLGYKLEILEGGSWLSNRVLCLINYLEEAWVDTEILMTALFSAMERLNVEFVIDEIVRVEKDQGNVKVLKGLKGSYASDFYLFALGSWTAELFDIPVYPIKGQALKLKNTSLTRTHYSSVSYLIPRDGYLYVGATSEDVGFLPGNTLEGIKNLSESAISVVPSLSKAQVISMLYGYRPATPDEMPIFEVGENYMVISGHYRNGILHAPISSQIALNYLKGSKSPYIDIFSSCRFS
ncbi:MAG: FAD-dependent oxidoreductase, partial [Aquificaceae bacterium]